MIVSYLCTNGGLCPWMGRLWWGTTVLPLSCCHIKCVASPLQQSLTIKKKNKGKKKKRWSRDRIIAFFGPKKHSLFNSVERSMKSVLEWFLNEPSVLTLILASSGPLLVSDTLVPCFSLCLYVFITPQRKALLFWKTNNLNGIKQ